MSKKLKKKAAVMFVVEFICIAVLGFFLTGLQTKLSLDSQDKDIKKKLSQMQELVDTADETAAQDEKSYDEVYSSKAESVAYLIHRGGDFPLTGTRLRELADMMNIVNIFVLDKEGNQLAASGSTKADFTYERYNQLRTVFGAGEPSEAFEVSVDGEKRRYYGARIDEGREAVVEQDPQELAQLLDHTSSWESILGKIGVGLEGFAFAVSDQDYTFLYHPDEDLTGTDALAAGLEVKLLEEGSTGWMNVEGERYYCGVTNIKAEHAYVILAVPYEEMMSSRNITVGIVLFIFFAVITIVILYAVLMMADKEKNGEQPENYKVLSGVPEMSGEVTDLPGTGNASGKLYFDKDIARRIGAISVVGLLVILLVSFYMQTLFSISRHSMNNVQRTREIEAAIQRNQEEAQLLVEQYNRRYLNKAQTASYILSENPQLQTREDLKELSQVLDVEFILLLDENGKTRVTDSNYTNFQLSQDPEEQSYEFNKLLQGVDYVIQEAQPDEVSGVYHQYIGVALRDEEGVPTGILQLSVAPEKLEEALETTKLSTVLKGVKSGTKGFAFAVDKEEHTFVYYPTEKYIGRAAEEYGMEESQFRDGFCDYLTLDGEKYYGTCLETDSAYVYVVIPDSEMTGTRLPVALATGAASFLCLLIVFLILTVSGKEETGNETAPEAGEGAMIDIVMPDGSVRKTEAAVSRWANLTVRWADKTPEQRIGSILKGFFSLLALAICAAVLFKESFFDSNSIFLYVISGNWGRGINVFAITGCIMIICVASVLIMVLREILKVLSKTFGARGETICRLLRSLTRYVGVIAMLYYCFALFGVDTKTLLASAGILSLVIGLGAKDLVGDILAGLFIIFEGEFRVGDIVTIGDWRGTVMEIGVRTTKIEDPGNNVKIISNSAVSGVINMTRKNSYAAVDVGIEYGESLERVENILEQELPNIKNRIPAITDGPFYKGVVALGDNSVNIKIVAQCAENNRLQVVRDLNREMKLIFDRHDINIPFPQVVINQPKEYQQATEWEKWRADRFNEEQKELTKSMGEEREERE